MTSVKQSSYHSCCRGNNDNTKKMTGLGSKEAELIATIGNKGLRVFSVAEAAKLLGYSNATVSQLVHRLVNKSKLTRIEKANSRGDLSKCSKALLITFFFTQGGIAFQNRRCREGLMAKASMSPSRYHPKVLVEEAPIYIQFSQGPFYP